MRTNFIYSIEEIVINRSEDVSNWGKHSVSILKKLKLYNFWCLMANLHSIQVGNKIFILYRVKVIFTFAFFDDDSIQDWIEPSVIITARLHLPLPRGWKSTLARTPCWLNVFQKTKMGLKFLMPHVRD